MTTYVVAPDYLGRAYQLTNHRRLRRDRFSIWKLAGSNCVLRPVTGAALPRTLGPPLPMP
jgi:hypothetical protein